MLRRLQLENFKAWKKADMRLAPLTGLFGTNSSGKTSILQFLLMLKQTVESSDRDLVLNLNGNYVELGTFEDFILNNNTRNTLFFELEFSQKAKNNLSSPIIFSAQIKKIGRAIVLNKFFYFSDKEKNIGFGMYRTGSGYELLDDDSPLTFFQRQEANKYIPKSFFLFPMELSLPYANFFEPTIFNLASNIHYLGPLREYPKRNYTWGGERRSQLGNRGEFAIECILASRERGDIIEHEGEVYSLETYLAMWLRELGMIQDFKIDSITEGGRLFEVRVRQTEKSPYVLLTDVGFGVSQILPVLTLCYYTPKGSILLMEQPEIHLHPRVQAGLADVFIDAIKKRGVQIILESHSEHLLRRLQLRIAQEKFSSDNAALYFCEIKEGYSELCDLQLDEFGNIKNWPDNFFGDEMTEVFQMTEAIAERKKKAKLNGK